MNNSDPNRITIYCDGACSGNQSKVNKGGWGALLMFNGKQKQVSGAMQNTTNQRMELTACIEAVKTLKSRKYPVDVFSDSAYLVNCMQQRWYEKWERNGWKNAKKEPVENSDLWKILLELNKYYSLNFHKVKGHSTDVYNNLVDELARTALQKL